jgi:hypothetical protein
MAFAQLRTRELNFTGTATKTLAAVPAGTVVAMLGCRVAVAAGAGAIDVAADGATLMATAAVLPTATGLKRSATPTFFLMTAAANIVATSTLTGSPNITFYALMYKADPGAGEV